jgi:hypothetical protein
MIPYLEALGHRVDLVEMYVGGTPARVQINAPLALQQTGAHELVKTLQRLRRLGLLCPVPEAGHSSADQP